MILATSDKNKDFRGHRTKHPDPLTCPGSDGATPSLAGEAHGLALITVPGAATTLLLAAELYPEPVRLDALGAPGCALLVPPEIAWPARTDMAGRAAWVLPGALPVPLYAQALVLDPPANALGRTVSNAVEIPACGRDRRPEPHGG